MGAIIAKQPNGLLCQYSSITGNITEYNLTEDEYIELCVQRAREEAKETLKRYLKPFKRIVDEMENNVELGYADDEDWKKLLSAMSAQKER